MDEVAAARRLIEVAFSRNQPEVLDDLVAEDCLEHQRGLRPGREGAKGAIATLHAWFSDFSLTIEDLSVSGSTVWCRNRARGVDTGGALGFPPTGRPFEIDVVDVMRFEGGRMVEHWGVPDQLGLLAQLGHLPWPGQAVRDPAIGAVRAAAPVTSGSAGAAR